MQRQAVEAQGLLASLMESVGGIIETGARHVTPAQRAGVGALFAEAAKILPGLGSFKVDGPGGRVELLTPLSFDFAVTKRVRLDVVVRYVVRSLCPLQGVPSSIMPPKRFSALLYPSLLAPFAIQNLPPEAFGGTAADIVRVSVAESWAMVVRLTLGAKPTSARGVLEAARALLGSI